MFRIGAFSDLHHPSTCGIGTLPLGMVDWQQAWWLALALPILLCLFWLSRRSTRPMTKVRKPVLLVIRATLVLLALAALAGPALPVKSDRAGFVFVLDHSQSMGAEGLARIHAVARQLTESLPDNTPVAFVAAGSRSEMLERTDVTDADFVSHQISWMDDFGDQTDLAAALRLASGLFPAGVSRQVVLITDGFETRGNLQSAAREASLRGVVVHARPVDGEARPDARITGVSPSRNRLHEGAALELRVGLESSLAGEGRLRLFENGIEVENRPLSLLPGQAREEVFRRIPDRRNMFHYRAVLEGFQDDTLPDNNEGLAVVDVRGRPVVLLVEGEDSEVRYLIEALAREGIRTENRAPQAVPGQVSELAGFDAIILSDVSADLMGEAAMRAMRDYVDQLGGGLVMIGGPRSFALGGYMDTPLEDILPVRLQTTDQEEQPSLAIALVLDRSGSMHGERLDFCKLAAAGVVELLGHRDFIGVFAFDTEAHTIVPMSRVTSAAAIIGQINTLSAGGGTNMFPGMVRAREQLSQVNARVKHMIVLGDGQTLGEGYETLAAQCRAEGMTVSTVSVGEGSWVALMQSIAAAGGGQGHVTTDASAITRIFTQDTLLHSGRMIREQPFQAVQTESHPMLSDWPQQDAPPLLGYVKTGRRPTAQVPLVTDLGDPLLAHWRFGLGKVTAFTSDAKSRWASLWVAGWPGFGPLWAQIVRETARPPQGGNMDLRLDWDGERAVLTVDLLQDAATRRDGVRVEADIFHLGNQADQTEPLAEPLLTLELPQRAPGLYRADFRPDQPGSYLIRARAGSRMVSTGLVHQPSTEAATGLIHETLLATVAAITGGRLLGTDDVSVPVKPSALSHHRELRPWLLLAMLALFLVDLLVRRWENVLGLAQALRPKPGLS